MDMDSNLLPYDTKFLGGHNREGDTNNKRLLGKDIFLLFLI